MPIARKVLVVLLSAAALLPACGDEDPTGVGGPLLPGGVIRSFEVVLDAGTFLTEATDLAGFAKPPASGFFLIAHRFGGSLESHALARFAPPPARVTFRDAAGTVREDTLPRFIGGQLVLRVDTLLTVPRAPLRLQLFRVAEAWDPGSADWRLRVDSGRVALAWSQPGGTVGALVDSAVWQPGTDSVVFAVDSQTVALWADTTNAARGALILAATDGTRMKSPLALLRLEARPSQRPDTVVTATVGSVARTFLFDPPPPSLTPLQVGGTPAWRSFLRFRGGLDTVSVACPGGAPGCRLRLGDATVNFAALLLDPLPVPAAFQPEAAFDIEARSVLETPGVPVARSPLGQLLGRVRTPVDPRAFAAGSKAPPAVEVPVTTFLSSLVAPLERADSARASTLALLATIEAGTFGFGTFAAGGTASAAPRLRIVLSIASEVQIQ
ncbi:MAG: hypothetical protein HY703_09720 [Gemmatimonadetes bacterium]|nr:hypothetical protein [Gemmatimonadota bacterium]